MGFIESRKRQAETALADDAVHSEPVSAFNSLLTGKNTGKFIKGGQSRALVMLKYATF
jgi:hypothetical protein